MIRARVYVGTLDVYSRQRARRPHLISILNALPAPSYQTPTCVPAFSIRLAPLFCFAFWLARELRLAVRTSCRSLGYLHTWCCASLDHSLRIHFVLSMIFWFWLATMPSCVGCLMLSVLARSVSLMAVLPAFYYTSWVRDVYV